MQTTPYKVCLILLMLITWSAVYDGFQRVDPTSGMLQICLRQPTNAISLWEFSSKETSFVDLLQDLRTYNGVAGFLDIQPLDPTKSFGTDDQQIISQLVEIFKSPDCFAMQTLITLLHPNG